MIVLESVSIEVEANSCSKLEIEADFLIIFFLIFVILYPYYLSYFLVSIIFLSVSLLSLTLIYLGSNKGARFFLCRSVSTGQVFSIDSISVLISNIPILFYIRDCSVITRVHLIFEAFFDWNSAILVISSLLNSSYD